MNLDRSETINDTFGQRVGDDVLLAVAGRLNEVLRPGDTLARIAGDEFVVLCEELGSAAQADAITARLDAALDSAAFNRADASRRTAGEHEVQVRELTEGTDGDQRARLHTLCSHVLSEWYCAGKATRTPWSS